ncbi:MAG: ATP-dependent Clp protease ATP-binding subunit [Vicinamibacteria bacterium]|nr:ATP-dependent Clp protease ATP-binding subunit [Vicinamibacteria bacterium]
MHDEERWKALTEEARRQDHAYLGVEHLFTCLLEKRGGRAEALMSALSLSPLDILSTVRRETGKGKGAGAFEARPTPRLQSIIRMASSPADEDLLLAMIVEGQSLPIRYLHSLGFDESTLMSALRGVPVTEPEKPSDETRLGSLDSCETAVSSPATNVPATHGPPIVPAEGTPVSLPTPTLDKMGRDLTRRARLGDLNDSIGRDDEINMMLTILARTQKSNPMLLGEAGVGKTAVVEGLAWRIANGRVPALLRGKRIIELDLATLTAGTSLRGQFEERIKTIVEEATSSKDIILFIDEIHTLVGAGGSSSNDAAQIFKPSLARGDFSCIGATTQDEYARYIRKDAALERRFSPVEIKELAPEATLAVLQKVATRIAEKQAAKGRRVSVQAEALRAAVALTDKYVKDRRQPDKAIDAIDIACARAVVRDRARVTAEDVAVVVSEWTGIPAGRMTAGDQERYARMEQTLGQRVIGQPEAVTAVSRCLRAALAGLKAANRPVGVFLFMGPSGVGKTKLAKELARFLFDAEEALVRFDMSQYQQKERITQLVGSSRGYAGSEQGGDFTEALRRRPYCVVLLDEIEKAHPDVFNLFLSVFDDGRVTDNMGRVVDCSNAVFILTSNLGEDRIGFAGEAKADLRAVAAEFLRPELVNRISEVVRFRSLGRKELSGILEQILADKMAAFQSAQQIAVVVDEAAKELILTQHYDPRMGARPLERAVDRMIVQPLVDAVFSGKLAPGNVSMTVKEDVIVFE